MHLSIYLSTNLSVYERTTRKQTKKVLNSSPAIPRDQTQFCTTFDENSDLSSGNRQELPVNGRNITEWERTNTKLIDKQCRSEHTKQE